MRVRGEGVMGRGSLGARPQVVTASMKPRV